MARVAGVDIDPATQIGAAVGTKEFVAMTPHFLRMRTPDRDTVLYPEVSYPSYEQGAIVETRPWKAWEPGGELALGQAPAGAMRVLIEHVAMAP